MKLFRKISTVLIWGSLVFILLAHSGAMAQTDFNETWEASSGLFPDEAFRGNQADGVSGEVGRFGHGRVTEAAGRSAQRILNPCQTIDALSCLN